MKYLFLITISVVLFSCSDNNLPRGILSQEKMETILWEQLKADAFTKEFISKDSSKNLATENVQLQQKLFAKYKIDKEDFYKSYQYYLKHDALMKDVLDSIVAKQTRIHQKEFEQKMSGTRVNDYEDIFKLKDLLKPSVSFKMQEPIRFADTSTNSNIRLKKSLISTRDSLKAFHTFRNKNRKNIQPSLQQQELVK
jgi:hypothetical protein